MSGFLCLGLGGDLFTEDCPVDIGAKFFAHDRVAALFRGALDSRAVFRRHAAVSVEPRPDSLAPGEAENRRQPSLTAKSVSCPTKRVLWRVR